MLAIRLRRMGSAKKPFYRVVVTEARTARESSFVENLGTYNPRSKPAAVAINTERVQYWLSRGARPSDTVRTLVRRHLTRDLAAPVQTQQPAASAAEETQSQSQSQSPSE